MTYPTISLLSTPPKELKILCLHNKLHITVCNSIIHKLKKMETSQISITWWMDQIKRDGHTVEYYSAIKRNEVLLSCYRLYGWTFENVLSEGSCAPKVASVRFHSCQMSRIGQFIGTDNNWVVALGWGEKSRGGVTAKGYGFLWGVMFWNLIIMMVAMVVLVQTSEFNTLPVWILWYVNYIPYFFNCEK